MSRLWKISDIFPHQRKILISPAKTHAHFVPGKSGLSRWSFNLWETWKERPRCRLKEWVYRVWISEETRATMKEKNSLFFSRLSLVSKIFSVQEILAVVIFLSNKQINSIYIYTLSHFHEGIHIKWKFILKFILKHLRKRGKMCGMKKCEFKF